MSPIYGMLVVARGLQKNSAAIRNGLVTKWSSGQVEGQNNRLKILKRACMAPSVSKFFVPSPLPRPHVGVHTNPARTELATGSQINGNRNPLILQQTLSHN
jgi:hypothetical protein